MAVVQDHREEIVIDEPLTAQPRALITVGSPMANRPKLHFGYSHPQARVYPASTPTAVCVPAGDAATATGNCPGAPPPVASGDASAGTPQCDRRRDRRCLARRRRPGFFRDAILRPVKGRACRREKHGEACGEKRGLELTAEDGWEDADPRPEGGRSAVSRGPIFSLSSLVTDPFEKYDVTLPDGGHTSLSRRWRESVAFWGGGELGGDPKRQGGGHRRLDVGGCLDQTLAVQQRSDDLHAQERRQARALSKGDGRQQFEAGMCGLRGEGDQAGIG